MKGTFQATFLAIVVALTLLPGAANAQGKCVEGIAANGDCVNPSISNAMRQSAVIFSQPKISYTAYPVLPTDDSTYRYPHELNPDQAKPSAVVGGGWPSDIRLKRDIVQVGQLDNGIGLYRYRYTWSDQVYVGVMAQEVAKVVPDAVLRGPEGFLRVNYTRLGLKLRTWDEWVASTHGRITHKLPATVVTVTR